MADGLKRVLVVHSFGNAAPPFTTHSIAFETELTQKMGEPVDLDEVSLDVARYADLDMEEALVELMRKRQAKWQPDLVVPIGSPAGRFVAQYRDRLFPKTTPIIYTGMDRSRLPAGAVELTAHELNHQPRRCLKGRCACAVFHDAAQRLRWTRRQRQSIFRLLLHHFGVASGNTTNSHHHSPATLWRVTVESWLRRQQLITVRHRQNQNVSTTSLKSWSQN